MITFQKYPQCEHSVARNHVEAGTLPIKPLTQCHNYRVHSLYDQPNSMTFSTSFHVESRPGGESVRI